MAANAGVVVVGTVVVSVAPAAGLALAQVGFVAPTLSVPEVDRSRTSSVRRIPFRLHNGRFFVFLNNVFLSL